MTDPFGGFYRGKVVLVTGHTGFKGSWLTLWLTALGARVVGYALEPPTHPNNYEACRLEKYVVDVHGDVRDLGHLAATVSAHHPDVIFHLAAQPLVRRAVREPRVTFEVNVMGTVNVLEAVREVGLRPAVVVVTSDKGYRNTGQTVGYREVDPLGGVEPYGASKACADLIVAMYQEPAFQRAAFRQGFVPIAAVRAGNAVGGGDWAVDRIIPDTVRAIVARHDLVLRFPQATRPWQHVLEPLAGYLWLGALIDRDRNYCGAWNFGPDGGNAVSVEDLVRGVLARWPRSRTRVIVEAETSGAEALTLGLDSRKARDRLGWRAVWEIDLTLDTIVGWYQAFYEEREDMRAFTLQQIDDYVRAAAKAGVAWTTA